MFIFKTKKTRNNMEPIISGIIGIIILYKFFTWKEKPAKTKEELRTRNLDKRYHD